MISDPGNEDNTIMKRNQNVGHVEKSAIGLQTLNVKQPLELFIRMHPKEQTTFILIMKRGKTGTSAKYANSIETQGNASLEQSASLSMINITDLT